VSSVPSKDLPRNINSNQVLTFLTIDRQKPNEEGVVSESEVIKKLGHKHIAVPTQLWLCTSSPSTPRLFYILSTENLPEHLKRESTKKVDGIRIGFIGKQENIQVISKGLPNNQNVVYEPKFEDSRIIESMSSKNVSKKDSETYIKLLKEKIVPLAKVMVLSQSEAHIWWHRGKVTENTVDKLATYLLNTHNGLNAVVIRGIHDHLAIRGQKIECLGLSGRSNSSFSTALTVHLATMQKNTSSRSAVISAKKFAESWQSCDGVRMLSKSILEGNKPKAFSKELWNQITDTYKRILIHPFVVAIKDGSLKLENFISFLQADLIFLDKYAKALASCAGKFPDKFQIQREFVVNQAISGILSEHKMIQVYLEKYSEYKKDTPLPSEAKNYINHLIALSFTEKFSVSYAAFVTCCWIYHNLAIDLLDKVAKDSPYREWLEHLASDKVKKYTTGMLEVVNELAKNADANERKKMVDACKESSSYDLQFFDPFMPVQKVELRT